MLEGKADAASMRSTKPLTMPITPKLRTSHRTAAFSAARCVPPVPIPVLPVPIPARFYPPGPHPGPILSSRSFSRPDSILLVVPIPVRAICFPVSGYPSTSTSIPAAISIALTVNRRPLKIAAIAIAGSNI